jgi:hypothetical protein
MSEEPYTGAEDDVAAASLSDTPQKPLPPEERRCTGTSAKTGQRCEQYAVKDSPRQLCAGHSGLGAMRDPVASAKRAAVRRKENVQERKAARVRTLEDARLGAKAVIARQLEQNAALYATRLHDVILHGSDSDAVRALQVLTDRVLGKPIAVTELTLDERQRAAADASVAALSPEERRARIHEVFGVSI